LHCNKLHATDWLKDNKPPEVYPKSGIVEVRFKNSRKDFFRADIDLELEIGDIVAVESSPGHDLGIVSLAGEVVRLQLKKKKINYKTAEFRKVYRKAKVSDIEKWATAVKQEEETMFRSRSMAQSLNLSMKISDVEYQGDRTKAIFYYTADERVDFRELIRVLADAFNVRIEMRQIGMRQEASRLGGIGSCGRELCCSTWLTQFRSVSTNAARTQQLSLNPQKLAGQCSKLKCCINYENDTYNDALKDFPDLYSELTTEKGQAVFQKFDVLRKMIGYSYKDNFSNIIMVPVERVKEIISLNRNKQFPQDLLSDETTGIENDKEINNGIESNLEDSLSRFDSPTNTKKRRKRKSKPKAQNNK
jgi:cell fate regulator YaaT (PSP1 superfamily)